MRLWISGFGILVLVAAMVNYQNCSQATGLCTQSSVEGFLDQKEYPQLIKLMEENASDCAQKGVSNKYLSYAYAGQAGFSTFEYTRMTEDVVAAQKQIKRVVGQNQDSQQLYDLRFSILARINKVLPLGTTEKIDSLRKSIRILEEVYGRTYAERNMRQSLELAGLYSYLSALELNYIINDTLLELSKIGQNLSTKEITLFVIKFIKSNVYLTLSFLRDLYIAALNADRSYPSLKSFVDDLLSFYKKSIPPEILSKLETQDVGDYLEQTTNLFVCLESNMNQMPEKDFDPSQNPDGYVPALPLSAEGSVCEASLNSLIDFVYKN